MAQFESLRQDIEAAGAQVVFIAAEKREGVWKPERFLEKHSISNLFLLDEDRTVTKAYGLYHALGTDAIKIAHPASLVIDCKGVVRYIYRGANQLDRAAPDELLKAVNGL